MDSPAPTEIQRLREMLRLTQAAMADRIGVPLPRYKNWEYGRATTPKDALLKARHMAATEAPRADVGEFRGAITEAEVLVPYIGKIAASSPLEWGNPLEAPLSESVPVHMAAQKGVFTARVGGDSMMPFLQPDDLCIFVVREDPPPGLIVYYIQTEFEGDGAQFSCTIKQLKHDGQRYILHALNPSTEDVYANGRVIGVLTGYIREIGKRKITDYDPDGIRL